MKRARLIFEGLERWRTIIENYNKVGRGKFDLKSEKRKKCNNMRKKLRGKIQKITNMESPGMIDKYQFIM